MYNEVYVVKTKNKFTFKEQELVSKKLKSSRIQPIYRLIENGMLLLLSEERRETEEEYIKRLKTLYDSMDYDFSKEEENQHRKSYRNYQRSELSELQSILNELNISHTIEYVNNSTLEYVFWVNKDNHSDIILRSTADNLSKAFSELQSVITDSHKYLDYDLKNITLHYKTPFGYIGNQVQYYIRKPLSIQSIQQDSTIQLLDYL